MTNPNYWNPPPGQSNQQLYQWAQRWAHLFQQGRHKEYASVSVTLSAGTSSVIAYTGMTSASTVVLTPTNAAAAALSPYVSAKTAGTGFTLTHGAAGGTETFNALVFR